MNSVSVMRKWVVLLLLSAACVMALLLITSWKVNAAKVLKSDLADSIECYSDLDILCSYYADFDHDGKKEMFAVVGEDMYDNEVWFASEKQVKCVNNGNSAYINDEDAGIKKVSNKQSLFVMETGGYGSGSTTLCCCVRKGKAYKVKQKNLSGLKQQKGKKFTIAVGDFDAFKPKGADHTEGHTWKLYYVKWIGNKFKEYTGKYISLKKMKKYKGAKKILKKIRKAGYKTRKIIKRSNGIININVIKKDKMGTYYDNVTLKIKKKKVIVVYNGWLKKGNIVERSSYRGIYKRKVM